uniref:Rab-3-interacting molecule unc-10 n=1 Tax=Trichuris muris TaxID=70415 RepID=A0A5S6QYQ2_TRIMR
MTDVMPDLSHLTEEERQIIERVLQRQKAEESQEQELKQKYEKQLRDIEKQIEERMEVARKLVGTMDDAICQICQKTKFADGIGHKCYYCQLRSCARCGGRLQIKVKVPTEKEKERKEGKWYNVAFPALRKKNAQSVAADLADQAKSGNLAIKDKSPTGSATQQKTIWSCSPCQQRQQILAKTGKWFYSSDKERSSSEVPPLPADTSASSGFDRPVTPLQKEDSKKDQGQQDAKRNGRSQEARMQAEESLVSVPSGSELKSPSREMRRDPSTLHKAKDRLISTESNSLQSRQSLEDRRSPTTNERSARISIAEQDVDQRRGSTVKEAIRKTSKEERGASVVPDLTPTVSQNATTPQKRRVEKLKAELKKEATRVQASLTAYAENDNGDRSNPQQQLGVGTTPREATRPQALEKTRTDGRSSPRAESLYQKATRRERSGGKSQEMEKQQQRRIEDAKEQQAKDEAATVRGKADYQSASEPLAVQPMPSARRTSQSLLGTKESFKQANTAKQPKIKKQEEVTQYDADTKEIEGTHRRRHRSPSAAGSSESGVDQSHYPLPARSRQQRYKEDRGDQERSLKENKPAEHPAAGGPMLPSTAGADYGLATVRRSRHAMVNSTKQRSFSSSDDDFQSTSECQSYDDMESESFSDRGELGRPLHSVVEPTARSDITAASRQLPLQWQSSPDGTYIYRRVVLHRHVGTSLGLKVVGGRSTPAGRLGAFITKVKRGSVADTTGRLVPGDEVLEWNGQSLQNASFDEVCNAINQSKFSKRIDLVIARNIVQPTVVQNDYPFPLPGFASELQTAVMAGSSSVSLPTIASTIASGTVAGQAPIVMITAPLSEVLQLNQHQQLAIPSASATRSKGQIFGQISISVLYIPEARQLIVNLLEAVDLPPRVDGTARNPYVKMFLLPDRSEKSRRQSKTMAETCHPVWQQSMLYRDVTEMDIEQKIIEITVWDYDQYSSNDFLGEVLVDLSSVDLDDTAAWYTLIDMDEETSLRKKLGQMRAHFASVGPYSTAGSLATYSSQEELSRQPSIALTAMKPSSFAVQGRRRRYETNYGARSMHNVRSGYRSDSALPMQAAAGPTYYEEQKQARGYDSEELEERRLEPEVRISGYYSDYGERQRSNRAYRQHQRIGGWRQWQPSEAMERRAMIPLELRPSSPTEESGNETSSPSHPNLRHLPRPPTTTVDRAAKMPALQANRSRLLNRDMDLRYTSGKTPVAESRGRLRNRSNFISGDYLSDESETSASLASAHCEQPTGSVQKFRDDRFKEERSPEEEPLTSGQLETQESTTAAGATVGDQYAQAEASEAAFFEGSIEGDAYKCAPSNSTDSMTAAEKRKKSLMNRLIPGRSNSSQPTNEQKRIGFRRSDEVGVPPNLSPQTSFDITKQSSRESTDSNESSLVPKMQEQGSIGEFVEGLGPGQVIGRQAIASPCLGEILLTLCDRNGNLEVKVVRAKHLTRRTGSKFYPSPYVKVYLCNEKSVVAKAKTGLAARNPEPRFDQLLIFTESYQNRLLQVIVVGDYGRMERKSLIGVATIKLANLDLSKPVEGWYKLYQNG